jgi:hypothetical protein
VEVLFKDLEVDMNRFCRCKGEMTMKLVGQQGCALGTQQTKTSQCKTELPRKCLDVHIIIFSNLDVAHMIRTQVLAGLPG